jgi:hypothetical protein
MSFTVSKLNGKLIFKDKGGYETRNPSTAWCIQEADKIYKWKDFNEIQIDTNDNYNGHGCSYIKDNYKNLVPDFVFHSWPQVGIYDYIKFTKDIDNAGLTPYEINKVGWIGNSDTNFRRKTLLQIGNNNNDLFDIFDMKWIRSLHKTNNQMLNSTNYIYTPDLVKKYSILIDIEGNGPYSARLKTLLWSHRPLLLVDRPGKEYFFEFLQEWTHYIPVKRDLSDLLEKAKWCIENYDQAKQIAENAYEFSKKYLTRDACYEQWNKIITNS